MAVAARSLQSHYKVTTSPEARETPSGESLRKFLVWLLVWFVAELPRLWRQSKVRPTHAARVRGPQHWRNRKDRFEEDWGNLLVWFHAEPDATGKALFARLQAEHPDRFGEAQLRTLQRRVKEWRAIMTKVVVYAGPVEPFVEPNVRPELALTGADPRC